MITGLYFAIFGAGLALLFLNVVKNRRANKILFGDGNNDALIRARSVHSNYVETVPFILLLMLMLEQSGFYPDFVIHIFGIGMIISRALHFHGITVKEASGKTRVFGSAGFIFLLLGGAVLLLIDYIL